MAGSISVARRVSRGGAAAGRSLRGRSSRVSGKPPRKGRASDRWLRRSTSGSDLGIWVEGEAIGRAFSGSATGAASLFGRVSFRGALESTIPKPNGSSPHPAAPFDAPSEMLLSDNLVDLRAMIARPVDRKAPGRPAVFQ